MDYLSLLKVTIANTDLDQYLEDEAKLEYAIDYAKDEIATRYNVDDFSKVPPKYHRFVVEGAKWYLSMVGAESHISISENGISRMYKDTPDWLSHITPKVGLVKKKYASKAKNSDSLV